MFLRDPRYLANRRKWRRSGQRNLGIYYKKAKELERLNIDWHAGVTVQTLCQDPYCPTVVRWVHNQLEALEMRRPGHPLLDKDSPLSEDIRVILTGGLREFVDETGFRDIEIRTDYPGIFLSDYMNPDWIDPDGVVHPGGHR